MVDTIAIVGASLSGGRAALGLRQDGFDGRVLLIGGEPHEPYERPPLSKEILRGNADAESASLVPPGAYDEAEIELVLGTRAVAVKPADQSVVLADGRSITADKVLLTTGADPRPLTLPGHHLAGVHALRTLDDALSIRDTLVPGANVVVIGAGFIGAEVAATAQARGCSVTLIEMADLPLQRVLGPTFGALYADMHRSNGVSLHCNSTPEAIEGSTHCTAVRLTDGTVLPADVVVCGIGVTPAVALAQSAGATIDNGIVVDEYCRTSIPNLYAAGDVASRPSSYASGLIRLESWQNAQNHGIAAAASMLEACKEFDELPWFWSDQYDVNLQLAGIPSPQDTIVWRGDPEAHDGAAFYLRGGFVTGVVGLNRARDVRATMDIIRKQIPVNPAELTDESTNLRSLGKR